MSSDQPHDVARARAWPASAGWSLIGVVAVVAVGVGAAAGSAQRLGVESALCVLIGIITVAPLVIRWSARQFDLFEPATVVAAVYLVYFVIAPLVRFASDDLTFIGRNFEADYFPALVAVLVAVVSMWLGYGLPVGPPPERPGTLPPAVTPAALRRARRLGWTLASVAMVFMVLWARLAHRSLMTFLLPGLFPVANADEGGTDIAYLFLSIEWFIPALIMVMAAGGLRTGKRRLAVVLAVTLVYVSIGFRYRIVLLWSATVMLTYLQAERRPRLRNLLVPGVVAFVASGWLAQARLFFRSGGAYGGLGFDLRGAVLLGLADTRIFETFAAVLRAIPAFIPLSGVLPFAYPLILPIPRALWTGKPLPSSLQDIAASVGTPESGTAGLAVPHFGEYYLAFGWPGIALGMFVFGVGTKWLWRWYRAAPRDPWRQAIFALNNGLLFQLIIRGYFAQIVMEWCFLVLPALVIVAVARRAGRRGSAAPGTAPADVPGLEAAGV